MSEFEQSLKNKNKSSKANFVLHVKEQQKTEL